ncbi:MAG TPA: 1-acyl-sn-glycerol-3-phosphate acyltransferase [Terriglobales bacterium]|jgi:1-acyl-sn-glycerol-3-phosphate acyltransferase|nr:1-acyl-sn-glycerol-3-phosphate acyltransferase [Terriglobales bacterium]
MARIALIAQKDNRWANSILQILSQARTTHECYFAELGSFCNSADESDPEASYVYIPSLIDREGIIPDLSEAERVFQRSARLRPRKLVLLSSALIYGTGPWRLGLVSEDYTAGNYRGDQICSRWKSLEATAGQCLNLKGNVPLIILRPTTVLPSPALLSRRLMRRFTFTLPGHDPTLQLLSLCDLAEALLCALEQDKPGVFNVAPDGVVPLHAAVRIAHGYSVALPRTLQRLFRRSDALDYLRYPWTVSNKKIKEELGFAPRKSSIATVFEMEAETEIDCRKRGPSLPSPEPTFDDFGMDKNLIQSYGKTLFKFLCDYYWRIEVKGLEYVPREGPAILVGMHRGFMPWDGVMVLHQLVQKAGRFPRFLTHPGLLKFPFISSFVTKLGGVIACQESADRVLESGELLGVFPEGVRGAFTPYREAYRLKSFGRDAFVKIALRHRVRIVPFVTVGSAEIFPIFATIKSRRWTRYSDWPCLPLSTFPILPVPLPSKWHMQFLPAIHLGEQYPREAAQDASVIKAISLEVRNRMQQAVDEMIRKRRSVFFGSIFEPEEEAGTR